MHTGRLFWGGNMSSSETENGAIPLILMLAGTGTLFLSMLGAGKVLWDVLSGTISISDAFRARLVWLAILFFAGWGISLFNIRVLHSWIQPPIICVFIWATLIGILFIYGRIIFRLYVEDFGPDQYIRYSIAFVAGFTALISLHLLIEDHDLRPCAIPIALMVFGHILLGGTHYIFRDAKFPPMVVSDFVWLLVMLVMTVLIGRHFGLLNPFRRILNAIFPGDA
jgi:hypothetical protein